MTAENRVFEPVATSDARAVKVRLAVVQEEERATVQRSDEPEAMSFPHLVVREAVALLVAAMKPSLAVARKAGFASAGASLPSPFAPWQPAHERA